MAEKVVEGRAVIGVADTRGVPLAELSATGRDTATADLRRIVPVEQDARLPVCAFGSSI